ncbi:hypothetical protein [Brevibacillus borstelensis]|uniref:hypothetical protein n=1 Tax=Brevibacillus borstelensis TaxID=45462 RepID=UPI00046A111E|nr:hypothetical protein [Brevibacillus borstelensis]MCC0564264.1 hypothetical protein [Brevibacillus borstelensis]MCM3473383.1 hypothetical protein [Brevibacillus borstelensis]MCM3559497.1 hypothetical protein [Brevibacillus borstelensis]
MFKRIGKWEDHKISWNYKAEEIMRQYVKKRGIQKVVIRFVPKRKGTFTFEVKIEQEDGEKRGTARNCECGDPRHGRIAKID